MREKNWTVLISPYYNDNITDKPREIDIIAEKGFNVMEFPSFRKYLGTLWVRLFIECKYIHKEIAFWFDNKDEESAIKRIMKDTSLKHPDENVFIKEHHYYTSKEVAKLSASGSDKSPDKEIIYKALNQSLNAMVYYKSSPSAILAKRSGRALRIVNYPLILCNSFDKLYRVNSEKEEGYSQIDKNFQLEVNYAYLDKDKNSKSDYFLIDIVEFNQFDEFLTMLEKTDIKAIKNSLS